MKRSVFRAETLQDYECLDELLEKGWVLDPVLTDGKPYRLDALTIWPLVFYEKEEERPTAMEEMKAGEFDDVVDFKDVPNTDVQLALNEGYVIHAIYQKNTILVRRKTKEVEQP